MFDISSQLKLKLSRGPGEGDFKESRGETYSRKQELKKNKLMKRGKIFGGGRQDNQRGKSGTQFSNDWKMFFLSFHYDELSVNDHRNTSAPRLPYYTTRGVLLKNTLIYSK